MPKHFVSNDPGSVRLFRNHLLEALSKTHWTAPIWIAAPVLAWMAWRALSTPSLSWPLLFTLALAGFLVWTLTEYLLHRFVFHFPARSEWGKWLVFLFHGVHHDYPQDAKRLVMPPAVTLVLAVIFYALFRLLLGDAWVAPFFFGFAAGYLNYDLTHYAVHHFPCRSRYYARLRQYHMRHHYQQPDRGYGVSFTIWDKVFGTTYDQAQGS